MGGATAEPGPFGADYVYRFNPRSPWGERRFVASVLRPLFVFQSTLPVGGATCPPAPARTLLSRFNPRSPWGERQAMFMASGTPDSFNPRSPWGERHHSSSCTVFPRPFQSTLPVGGATGSYPWWRSCGRFQSTLPVGGATFRCRPETLFSMVSIHAPRGGSDANSQTGCNLAPRFNPRSPWGERQFTAGDDSGRTLFQSTLPVGGATRNSGRKRSANLFQSTLPVGGATIKDRAMEYLRLVSIHAPRGGSDSSGRIWPLPYLSFNPRSPWGERPAWRIPRGTHTQVSIHAPRGGSD